MLPHTVWRVHASIGLVSRSATFPYQIVRYKSNNTERARISPVQLRPYQENAVDACLKALQRGITRMGVSMPPGSGKTIVFVELLHKLPQNGKKSLILVKSPEVARQIAKEIKRMYRDTFVEIEQGKNTASGAADITIATNRSLNSGDRLAKFPPESVKAVVVDEAHHAGTKTHLSILSHFDPSIDASESHVKRSQIPIFGFSATLIGPKGASLQHIFQEIVYDLDTLRMIEDGRLPDLKFTAVKTNFDLSLFNASSIKQGFNLTNLAKAMNTSSINRLIVQSWERNASDRKSTLVFCKSPEQLLNLTDEFCRKGYDAKCMHTTSTQQEREQLFDDFEAGRFPILLSCELLTEGVDIPRVDCIVLARPTGVKNLMLQMIGRGLRNSSETGKQDCQIIEFVDSGGHVKDLISAPSIFDLDYNELEPSGGLRASIKAKQARLSEWNPSINMSDRHYIHNYNDESEWDQHTKQVKRIMRLSQMAWVACGGGFILPINNIGQIQITQSRSSKPSDKRWNVTFEVWKRQAHGKSHEFSDPKRILGSASLTKAVEAGDTFAKSTCPYEWEDKLLRTADWRSSEISELQRNRLQKELRVAQRGLDRYICHVMRNIHTLADVSRLTKGEAVDLITRLNAKPRDLPGRNLRKQNLRSRNRRG